MVTLKIYNSCVEWIASARPIFDPWQPRLGRDAYLGTTVLKGREHYLEKPFTITFHRSFSPQLVLVLVVSCMVGSWQLSFVQLAIFLIPTGRHAMQLFYCRIAKVCFLIKIWSRKYMCGQFFLRRFRDPIWVPRISNRVPRIRENYHRVPKLRENRVPRIREIGSLQIHSGYLTFSLKKPCLW